jgi:hypothetical protein
VTTIAPEVIEMLNTWEEISDAGRALAMDLDAGRFALGDVGARCASVYGDDSLGKLAADIGIARAHTFREYVRVARGYGLVTRATFQEAGLSWSHFREALRAKDEAELWLSRAADDGLTVAALARQIAEAIGKPVPPAKLWEGRAIVRYIGDVGVYVALNETETRALVGQIVIVKVYEATGEA